MMRTCQIGGCTNPVCLRGWCKKHWTRWRRHGDPLHTEFIEDPAARFWSKVEKDTPGGCWLWTAFLNNMGYGTFSVGGRKVYAHRFAYEDQVGPIPDGLVIDHLCRTPACVNPSHLQPVTQQENTRRGDTVPARNAAKTHCPQGHPYDEKNTYRNGRGWRQCRACERARYRAQAA